MTEYGPLMQEFVEWTFGKPTVYTHTYNFSGKYVSKNIHTLTDAVEQ